MINKFLLFAVLSSGANAFLIGCSPSPKYSAVTKKGAGDSGSKEPATVGTDKTSDGTVATSTAKGQDSSKDENTGGKTGGTQEPKPDTTQAEPKPTPPDTDSEADAIKKKCTPEVEYINDNSAGGKKFAQLVPDAKLAMVQAAHYVCSVLYKKASEVPPVTKVKLVLEAMDGVAYATGNATSKELHISTNYVNGVGGNAKLEIDGVLIHENTHIWQLSGNGSDGGLIEGVADYVRAGGSWYPVGSRNRKGGVYNEAYTTSAYFLGWVDSKYPGFAYKFNLAMKAYPGAGVFKTITGVDVNALWNRYQSEGTFSPNAPDWVAKQVPLQLGK